MELKQARTVIIAGWMLGLGALAISVGSGSITTWTLLVGLGVLPPLLLMRMWEQPAQTMSQSIREVLDR